MTRRFRPARFPGRGAVAAATGPGDRAALDALELGLVYDAFVRSPVAMAMIGMDGALVRCNDAWVAFAGAGDEGELARHEPRGRDPVAGPRWAEDRLRAAGVGRPR